MFLIVCILFTHRIGTKIVRVPVEEDKDDAVDDSIDDVYGMDWNEDDSNESSRDEFKKKSGGNSRLLVAEMKDLKIRVMDCDCGLHIDRDQNAAINIRNEGLRLLSEIA